MTNQNTLTTTAKTESVMDSRIYDAVSKVPFGTMLELLDVDITDIDTSAARNELEINGIGTSNITDDALLKAVSLARDTMETADNSASTLAAILGAIKAGRKYEGIKMPDNKRNYKTFKEFCADFMPEWSYKTLALYGDVGTYIYVPVAAGVPGFECLKAISALTPSRVKNLVPVIKDADRFSKLPALIPGDKESFTAREIEQFAKETKPTKPRTPDTKQVDGESETAETAETANETESKIDIVELSKLFMSGESEEGETQVLIPDKQRAIFYLSNIAKSPDASKAFVEWLAKAIR